MGNENSGRERIFTESSLVEALRLTHTITDAARLAGCAPTLIHIRSRESGAINQAIRDQARNRDQDIAEKLIEFNGSISKTAVALGMDKASVRYLVQRNNRLRDVYMEAREGLIDTAEDNVFAAVENGHLGYSWKILQTLGKDRGYTERKEVEAVHVHVSSSSTKRLVEMLDRHAEEDPKAVEEAMQALPEGDRALVGQALLRFTDPVEAEIVSSEPG